MLQNLSKSRPELFVWALLLPLLLFFMGVTGKNVLAMSAEDKMSCKLALGNSIFKSFEITFKAEMERTGVPAVVNANRKVEMTLTYTRSHFDPSAELPESFKASNSVYNVAQGSFRIGIPDLSNYSGAILDFDYHDDELGTFAVMKYMSDRVNAVGFFQCGTLPQFGWN